MMAPFASVDEIDWLRERATWPLSARSRFISADGLRWHVQCLGEGPPLLLIHGTGSSAHSWHRIIPLLAARWTVVAMDLPGHGFTRGEAAHGMSLTGMSRSLGGLLRALHLQPAIVIGHSAGAAIAVRLACDRYCAPRLLISLNGALVSFDRRYEVLFAPLAKLLAAMPFVPQLFSWRARDRSAVERLIASTGSRLQHQDVDLYWRLVRRPQHLAGALRMMSEWSIADMPTLLRSLPIPLLQIIGMRDGTVPPSVAERVCALLPSAMIVRLAGLGHLAHEEQPEAVARAVFDAAGSVDV
jgi:magnesium chelatase accessory protein